MILYNQKGEKRDIPHMIDVNTLLATGLWTRTNPLEAPPEVKKEEETVDSSVEEEVEDKKSKGKKKKKDEENPE